MVLRVPLLLVLVVRDVVVSGFEVVPVGWVMGLIVVVPVDMVRLSGM